MREIEFRGKWESNGKWIYGSLVAKRSGERLISNYNKMLEFEGNYVHPKTVGQYTGMEDKNGNKIFEGDILKSEKNNPENPHDPFVDIGAIRWQNGCFWFGCIDRIDVMIEATEDFEVIGNIHDSPDLLESNKNPFKNRGDECQCRCNSCMAEFMEGEIVIKDGVGHCPNCGETGYIQGGLEGTRMTFAERLVTARNKMGLTQMELAALAGMPTSSIGQFETGAREPSLQSFRKLVLALKVSADYFLDVDIAGLWGMQNDAAIKRTESTVMVCDCGAKCERCDVSLRHNG